MSLSRRFPRPAVAAALLPLLLPATASAARISGTVESGNVPLAGSAVRLFAAGSGPATPLGSTRSGSDGTWQLDYRAPAGAQLYALASGGARGSVRHGAELRLLAVAGAASGVGEVATLSLDERSTVAGAYALARFLDGGGRANGPSPGLPNAFATAANLFEARAGKLSFVLGNPPNGLLTEALPTFNTLSNLLATCGAGTARECRRLFAAARAPGAKRPADTLAAALAFARNPWHVTRAQAALAFGRSRRARSVPFRPALSSAPKAWTLVLQYTGGGMNAPGRMAFAADGTIWVGNNFQSPGTTAGIGLSALSPTGQPLPGSPFFGGGVRGPGWGTAVGPDGRVWNANFAGDSVSVNAADGRALGPAGGYTAGGPVKPQGIAVAPNGDVWVASFGSDSVIRYPRGIPDASTVQVIRGGGIENPFAIQVDGRGQVWVSNGAESSSGSVTVLTPDGRPTSDSPLSGGGLASPQGLALDSGGNAWVANLATASVTRISHDRRISRDSPLRSSVQGGWGVAVDGADHVWVAGFLGGNVTELCGISRTCPPGVRAGRPISPARSGYDSAAFEHITAVQIDSSGNVWLANNWTTGSPFREFVGGAGLAQVVGAATPVKTPLVGLPQRP